MKILNVNQIRAWDAYTIEHEPVSSIELMERASQAFVKWCAELFDNHITIRICCGTGNNGGDGLAAARLLHERGYDVNVTIVGDPKKSSDDFAINLRRLPIKYSMFDAELPEADVVVDALFGSGLTKSAAGIYAQAIDQMNALKAIRVAIDIPSGLFADQPSEGTSIVKADFTVSFQLPKLAFMFPEPHPYVGQWEIVDIGLTESFIDNEATDYYLIDHEMVGTIVKQPDKFDHKGSNGHALLVCGSYGKMGAAVLAGKAALRSGVGLLTMHIPKSGNTIIQTILPEAMTSADVHEDMITQNHVHEKYNAIGVGPGIGKTADTVKAVKKMLTSATSPLVIDADALNILAENRELLPLIPRNAILTPHLKEFQRLVGGGWTDDFRRLRLQRDFAKQYGCIVILKGPHTSITFSDSTVYFNSTGNPGMAKGGSGDVLTGILTSLLAQGYSGKDAATLGVYLHGLAGDLVQAAVGEISMTPSDIIHTISKAYHQLNKMT